MSPDPQHIRALFTRIAGFYDRLNRVLTLGIDVWWRRRALAAVVDRAPQRVLDLATGTADLAIAAARRFPAARVTGLDLTPAMLDLGRGKVAAAGLADRVELLSGDASALPFAAAAFDLVTCAFGFRNFSDVPRALAEAARVLAPDGRLVVLELFRPPRGVLALFTQVWLRCVSTLFVRGARADYAYLRASIAHTLSAADFVTAAAQAGLHLEKKEFFRPSCHFLCLRKYDRIAPV